MGRLKICMLISRYPLSTMEPIVSGEIKNPFYLANALKRRGHHITILTTSHVARKPQSINGLKIYWVRDGFLKGAIQSGSQSLQVMGSILRMDELESYDLFHAHSSPLGLGVVLARALKKLDKPIVATAHGTYIPEMYANLDDSIRGLLLKFNAWLQYPLDRMAYVRSDVVVPVSRYQIRELVKIYKVPRYKIKVIYNGVNIFQYKPLPSESENIKQRYGIRGKRVVLFVGRIVKKKGLQHLIAAAPHILHRVPDAMFLVVAGLLGTSRFLNYQKHIHAEIARYQLQDKFIWIQDVPESEMPAFYNAADVCVVPSMKYESIPTVILEAMACGVPVVATNAWGIPEVICQKECLFREEDVNELARCVINLLLNRDYAAKVARSNREAAKQFSWDNIASRYEGLYREVLVKHGITNAS